MFPETIPQKATSGHAVSGNRRYLFTASPMLNTSYALPFPL
jgi:hypothetical protein